MNNRQKQREEVMKQCLMIAPHIDKEGLKEFKDKKMVYIPVNIQSSKKAALLWSFKHNTVIAIKYERTAGGEEIVIELFR